MIRQSVKKPFTVLVAVVMVIALGIVSLTNMTADLLPGISLPYMMVVTTYPGASPEKVEADVTLPLEAALGKVNGVKNVSSTSGENFSMVQLEFEEGTNMDSAQVKVFSALDPVEATLPDGAGTPSIIEISADMMATAYVGFEYEGKDIFELTRFAENEIVPYIERVDGVASVTSIGLVEQTIHVELDEAKVDALNNKILAKVNKAFASATAQLNDARAKLVDGQKALDEAKDKLPEQWEEYNKGLAEFEKQKSDMENNVAQLEEALAGINQASDMTEAFNAIDRLGGITGLKLISNIPSLGDRASEGLKQIITGYNGLRQAAGLEESTITAESITQSDWATIKADWPKLWAAASSTLNGNLSLLKMAQTQLDAGQAQLDAAKTQLEGAPDQIAANQKTLDESWKTYRDSVDTFNKQRETALNMANADQLLNLQTLAQLIYAQDFEMPAGYIDDKNDNSWLLKVGENIKTIEDLNDIVLSNIDGVGDIKVSDVANITLIDNADDTYAKVNGDRGVLLAVYKGSTYSTKTVGDDVIEAAKELEKQYDGLRSINFFNQGDYISLITGSILQSMIIGAVLAIIILAIFLKDYKPTVVVAISIPLSVLLAIVALYFSNISLNIMSLAGLALGVGMLVDNSIVVIENIYRLKTLGYSAGKAAVVGAKQVAAPIISSTLTTICVFLPMIFTKGLIKELLVPMAVSVVYCLVGSLLVALTVVPAAGSTLLKNSTEKDHKLFDRVMVKYGKSLDWCLDHKKVSLGTAIALLAVAIFAIIKMGVVMIPEMYAEPLAVTINIAEEKTRAESYEIADQVINAVAGIDGVETASAMTSESMLSMFSTAASGSTNAYHSYLCYVLLEGDNIPEKTIKRIVRDIEEATADIDCEISISANEMDLSMLYGSGLSINVYGNDMKQLESVTNDLMDIVSKVDGYENISNGMEDGDDVVHVYIDKNKAMSKGLSVAQIYMNISSKLTDTVQATALTIDGVEMDLEITDGTHPITKENILDYEISVTGADSNGAATVKNYKLGDFATVVEEKTLATLKRTGNSHVMTVTATVAEGKNATLLGRELEPLIEQYKAPSGYRVEFAGESETVTDMLIQMSKLMALGFLFIYLVMVAQFQSLLSPFIVLFTIPLAFTGGMAGLIIKGENLSVMSLMGFMILMGTVVNNGIVFVDYVNQLRIEGKNRRAALIETGKTRMRPILMTALTTILAMSKLLFGSDIGSQMGGGMAVVIMGGLTYATFMTLYIIPVIYDIFFKKQPLNVVIDD